MNEKVPNYLAGLADFDQVVSLGNEGFNLREKWLEPFKQSATAGIADPEPNDDRTNLALAHAVRKILVFGDDDGLVR